MGRRDLCSELNATKIVFQVVNCLRFTLFFKADEMMLDCNSMKSCILKIYHEANITRGYFAVFSLLDIWAPGKSFTSKPSLGGSKSSSFLFGKEQRRSKKILIHSRSVFTQRNVNSWIGDSLLINLVAFLVTLKIDLGRIGPLVFTGGWVENGGRRRCFTRRDLCKAIYYGCMI